MNLNYSEIKQFDDVKAAIEIGDAVIAKIYGLPAVILGYNDDDRYLLVRNWLGKTCKLKYPICSIEDCWVLKEGE